MKHELKTLKATLLCMRASDCLGNYDKENTLRAFGNESDKTLDSIIKCFKAEAAKTSGQRAKELEAEAAEYEKDLEEWEEEEAEWARREMEEDFARCYGFSRSSCADQDYSPSCPWNAPGMSVADFI